MDHKIVPERFLGLAGTEVASYCGERAAFLGAYRGYGNPNVVERGDIGGALNYNGNSCGVLSAVVASSRWSWGERRTVALLLGKQDNAENAAILHDYAEPETVCAQELAALRADWDAKLVHFCVKTFSMEFDTMLNIWNAYNCFMTFTWSRAASFTH